MCWAAESFAFEEADDHEACAESGEGGGFRSYAGEFDAKACGFVVVIYDECQGVYAGVGGKSERRPGFKGACRGRHRHRPVVQIHVSFVIRGPLSGNECWCACVPKRKSL